MGGHAVVWSGRRPCEGVQSRHPWGGGSLCAGQGPCGMYKSNTRYLDLRSI